MKRSKSIASATFTLEFMLGRGEKQLQEVKKNPINRLPKAGLGGGAAGTSLQSRGYGEALGQSRWFRKGDGRDTIPSPGGTEVRFRGTAVPPSIAPTELQ